MGSDGIPTAAMWVVFRKCKLAMDLAVIPYPVRELGADPYSPSAGSVDNVHCLLRFGRCVNNDAVGRLCTANGFRHNG